jgi:hypothetical protein
MSEPALSSKDLNEAQSDNSAQPQLAPLKSSPKGSADSINLAGYEIFSSQPVPAYDSGEVKAYKASAKGGQGGYFALVCEPHLVPRHTKIAVFEKIINANIFKLMTHGVVNWTPARQQRYIFIYLDPAVVPFIAKNQSKALDLRPEIVLEKIVRPMVSVLQDFRDKDFVHGNIHAGNIYYLGSVDFSKIILGECLTSAHGSNLDVIYEPIDRAMALPLARGIGTQSTDLYSLGVTLTVLLRSHDPLVGVSDDEIIKRKVANGTYATITSKDRFTGNILELLRGLLHDDNSQRWTIDEVLVWLEGRRINPKSSPRKLISPRPITFMGRKYMQPEILAMVLHENPPEVKKLVDEGEVKNWLTRALEENALYEKVEEAIGAAKNLGTAGFEDRLASTLSMVFDPLAPIRFRGLCLSPNGVGNLMAQRFVQNQDMQKIAEMFWQNIFLTWVKFQQNPSLDIGAIVSKFDSCRMFMRQPGIGFGLERCLYLLNPEAPCMSEKLKEYYIKNPEDMMHAFEDLCQKGKAPTLFIDRHIAAFLSIKDNRVIESYLADINSPEIFKKILGNLKCLATLQKRSQLPYFPGIATAIADQLGVVYERYHDRSMRETLKKNITRYAQEGDLLKMGGLLDNFEVQQKDFLAFKKAMREYHDLKKENDNLEYRLSDGRNFGIATGQEAAALISSVISALIILFVTFMYLSKTPIF